VSYPKSVEGRPFTTESSASTNATAPNAPTSFQGTSFRTILRTRTASIAISVAKSANVAICPAASFFARSFW
jgi:hypothetical protein